MSDALVAYAGVKVVTGWKQGRGITRAAQAQRGSSGIPLLEPKGILYRAGGLPPSSLFQQRSLSKVIELAGDRPEIVNDMNF